jgi:hypothetical protein
MTPQPSSHLTIIFKNGLELTGTVISWSKDQAILRSITGGSTIVIEKLAMDDIYFYKISHAKEQFEARKEKVIKTDDDIRDMAKLKAELNDLERETIRKKLSSHEVSGSAQVNYGSIIPKIARTPNNPATQSRRQDTNAGEELQSLFAKKH